MGPEQENMSLLYFPKSRAMYTVGRSALMEATVCLPDFHRVWAFWKPGWEFQGELAALRSQVRVNRIIWPCLDSWDFILEPVSFGSGCRDATFHNLSIPLYCSSRQGHSSDVHGSTFRADGRLVSGSALLPSLCKAHRIALDGMTSVSFQRSPLRIRHYL